jgi:hypothetical protein
MEWRCGTHRLGSRRHDGASCEEWIVLEFVLCDDSPSSSECFHVCSKFVHARKVCQNHLIEL